MKEHQHLCQIQQTQVLARRVGFLGHVISPAGIYMDPQKVQAVLNRERLTTVIKVRIFLGLACYYRHFVKAFPNIAGPLHRLTRKQVNFIWVIKCEGIFQ